MILKFGENKEWYYKQLHGDVKTKFDEDRGIYIIGFLNKSGEAEKVMCTDKECYLMSDSGTTIDNLSPVKRKGCITETTVTIDANSIHASIKGLSKEQKNIFFG